MSDRWAVSFPRTSAHAALPLRLLTGIEAHDAGKILWLRGDGNFADVEPVLHRIPDAAAFTVDDDSHITPLGRRIPTGQLPAGPWLKFPNVVKLQPQRAALPATAPAGQVIRLSRTQQMQEPGAMILPLQRWADYATAAPQVRLDALRFAVRADGRTLILGTPLPPIPGEYLANHDGLLIPSGYEWTPRVEASIVRKVLNLHADDLALFNLDGSFERISAESLVLATRSAARYSLQGSTSEAT